MKKLLAGIGMAILLAACSSTKEAPKEVKVEDRTPVTASTAATGTTPSTQGTQGTGVTGTRLDPLKDPNNPLSKRVIYFDYDKDVVKPEFTALIHDNPKTHELSTGPEIWDQTEGRVTDVIIGMGTGGTISGVGRYLKSKNPKIKIVGVDIEGSILTEIWQNKGKIPEGAYPKTYKVEGIGEDFLPSATDLSVVDWIERAGDRESFLWARQLVRQEGIFAGGSSGSAIAGAVKYCRRLTPDRLAVVIIPDSGSRYLSKFYDDKWMREFGFLSMEFGETALGDLLIAKPDKTLYTAALGDSMRKVVAVMHEHGISQMPVVGADGSLVGLIEEVDLLNHMLEEHDHSQSEPIDPLVQNASAVFPPETLLEEAMSSLKSGLALIVVENSRPVGILTKIDVLDYVAGKI